MGSFCNAFSNFSTKDITVFVKLFQHHNFKQRAPACPSASLLKIATQMFISEMTF